MLFPFAFCATVTITEATLTAELHIRDMCTMVETMHRKYHAQSTCTGYTQTHQAATRGMVSVCG